MADSNFSGLVADSVILETIFDLADDAGQIEDLFARAAKRLDCSESTIVRP